ncbi:hypothetical protein PT931_13485 [Longispora urticae]
MTDEDEDSVTPLPVKFSPWNAAWIVCSFAENLAATVEDFFSDLGLLCGAHARWEADRTAFADRTRADIEALP